MSRKNWPSEATGKTKTPVFRFTSGLPSLWGGQQDGCALQSHMSATEGRVTTPCILPSLGTFCRGMCASQLLAKLHLSGGK